MDLRLGRLLVDSGSLSEAQLVEALEQPRRPGEPLGVLAERLFGVDPAVVETAWARQYASMTRTIDPEVEVYDEHALELVTRRQAWQFRVLPVRFDPIGLMVATTRIHLHRALRFTTNVIGVPVFFVLAEPEALGAALCRHYPMPGMGPKSVLNDGLDRFLSSAGEDSA